jgi:tRNA threonylcarbamoyladenosine biosynthesis protein TsaE
MNFTLRESDWGDFIKENIVPRCSLVNTASVFALVGDLGAGKTTFSKTFLKELGIKQHVQSPTFSIINTYDITGSPIKSGMTGGVFKKVFHIDVYRIDDIKELEVLHLDEILSNPEHVVIIEWADKIKAHIPKGAHWIYFEHDTLESRKVTL